MQRFFESKSVCLTICTIYAIALLWNVGHGTAGSPDSHSLFGPVSSITVAHGASAPPDPWEGVKVAHGASAPPDPWEGVKIAHGASAPPDPWEGVRG